MNKIKINVNANSTYLPEQSIVANRRFFWSYEITVVNDSHEVVQLLNRYWRITDMTGYVEEVRGPGVVGMQPVVKPGKQFTYTSFCQLTTPQGTMEGHYEMQAISNDTQFIVEIPKFVLSSPTAIAASFHGRLH
jgi:ApaG protein